MRSRRTAQDELAAIARRRLDLVSAELAGLQEQGQVARAERVRAVEDDEADDIAHPGADPAPHGWSDEPAQPEGASVRRPGRHARRPVGGAARARAWVHDRLPPTLQGRVRLGAAHVALVALMVALGLAVTSWWVLRADGEVTVVPARAESMPSQGASGPQGGSAPALVTPVPEQGESPAAEPAVVVVDVAGKVRRPGIATLPVGARVVDALEAAGGVRRGVDLTSLNLARVLVDGEQVVVGVPAPGGVAAPAASAPGSSGPGTEAGALVNVNTAGQAQLEELPGVGPVTAAAILQWRSDHGPFTAVDELMEVSGIGEATLAEIAPFVTL